MIQPLNLNKRKQALLQENKMGLEAENLLKNL